MRTRQAVYCGLFLAIAVLPSFAHHIAVVVDKQNTVGNVSAAQLSKICKGEVATWPDGRPVVLVLHRASADEVRTLGRLTKWSEKDLKAFIAAHPQAVRLADSDEAVIERVQSTRGAIGFVEARSITDAVNVVKIDNKLPHEAGYLSH